MFFGPFCVHKLFIKYSFSKIVARDYGMNIGTSYVKFTYTSSIHVVRLIALIWNIFRGSHGLGVAITSLNGVRMASKSAQETSRRHS